MVSEIGLLNILVVVVLSYLLGSFPTAYILARLRGINIFEQGSGNMGGTNVARSMGMKWGILTAIIDGAKGVLAVAIARHLMFPATGTATAVAGIVVIIGHNWSLFATLLTTKITNGRIVATFKGGKGAATAFGTMLMIAPIQILIGMWVIGGLIVLRTRYVSLGVLAGYALAIGWMILLVGQELLPSWVVVYSIALAVLLILRFRGNIDRLLRGTERRIGEVV